MRSTQTCNRRTSTRPISVANRKEKRARREQARFGYSVYEDLGWGTKIVGKLSPVRSVFQAPASPRRGPAKFFDFLRFTGLFWVDEAILRRPPAVVKTRNPLGKLGITHLPPAPGDVFSFGVETS